MKLSKIKPNPDNPRILKDDKFRKLVKSIQDFPEMMEKRPIVVDENNVVLGGNMRLRALQEIYGKNGEVPDNWVTTAKGWSKEKKKEFVIKDNSSFGEWDWDMLANEWDTADLSDWGVDFPQDWAGGTPTEEEKEAVEDDFDETRDEVPTICKDGDIWQLGEHRLMCGDSTDAGSVALLMNGERADLVFTDPPYGMKKESEGVLNDNLNFDDLLEFNKRWIPLTFANLKDNGSWYCWGIDEPLMDIYSNILRPMQKRNEITFRNLITWDKKTGQGQNSQDFRMYPIADEKCLFVMVGIQDFSIEYNEMWKPVRDWMIEQESRSGLTRKQLNQVLGVASTGGGMATHYFGKQVGQYSIPTEEMYNKLRDYCAQNGIDAFQRDYKSLSDEYESIKSKWYKSRAYFDNTHDNMNNVWHFDRTSAEEREGFDHATPKPIALCGRGIKSSSREGEIVLDVFGGSGSTMIACEQLNRKCYMMELDAHYVSVILSRYIKFKGSDADVFLLKDGNKIPYNEVSNGND